jgi:selenocysteine lyase/cysteine desulfurase
MRTVGAAAAAPFLAQLASAQRLFGAQVEDLELSQLAGDAFQDLRAAYMLAPDVVYLNHASIGTIPRAVHDARVRYLALCETNPWLYMWGGEWEEPREVVRGRAARLLRCEDDEIAITHNTTEMFNVLAAGLPFGRGDEVLFSSFNHDGASIPFDHHATERGYRVTRFSFPIADIPRMSADDVLQIYDDHITPNTRLLVFPHVDNIVGLRHPGQALAQLARSRGVEFIAVDAAQTVGMVPVDARAMGVDVIATSPHKWLQAPKGLGLAYVSAAAQASLRPMWVTWGQGRWEGTARVYEDYGTRNLAEVLALGDAIDFQSRIDPSERERRLRSLWEFTRSRVERTDGTGWASPATWDLAASLIGVTVPGDSSQLSRRLFADHGIVFRPFNVEGRHSVRLSPNVFTTEEEIDRFFRLVTA